MSWSPDPRRFLADLEAKPDALRGLSEALDGDAWARPARRVTLIGMGSSWFAAQVGAARLRAHRIDAVAERASATAVHPGGPGTLAIGISASGSTSETVDALRRHAERGSRTLALTNDARSDLAGSVDGIVEMLAGPEEGGVACRTFQHTLARLLELEGAVTGEMDARHVTRRAADATEQLLTSRGRWLPAVVDVLTGATATFLIAPAERISSAEQGALMLREGPRRIADACETGDWLHVDVYLTKTLDYRALLFAGSRFDDAVMGWVRERGSTVVAVGWNPPDARTSIRYSGDDDADVALLTETLVPELVAASVWTELEEEDRSP